MNTSILTYLFGATILLSNAAYAAMDVDDADSLRFHSFHEQKDGSLKVYDDHLKGLTLGEHKTPTQLFHPHEITNHTTQTTIKGMKGQAFEIRERYTLVHSPTTTLSVITVKAALYQQMADICTQGWQILREYSLPIETDFYMHYEFECL